LHDLNELIRELRTTSVELTVLVNERKIASNLIVEVNDFFFDTANFKDSRNVPVQTESSEKTKDLSADDEKALAAAVEDFKKNGAY
jgi:hypothetical protein